MKISVIIPVFNEKLTVRKVINRINKLPFEKEIIVVDDGSTDDTTGLLKNLESNSLTTIFHKRNKGKGAAIRTGLKKATGEIVVIQDADLEYNPAEIPSLITSIIEGSDVVYGSRFIKEEHPKNLLYFGNRILNYLTMFLFLKRITDMETAYKVFRTEVIRKMNIRAKRFDFEPEVTAKIFKGNYKFTEIPISYRGRTYKEGKKLTWKDGFYALWTLLKYRFRD